MRFSSIYALLCLLLTGFALSGVTLSVQAAEAAEQQDQKAAEATEQRPGEKKKKEDDGKAPDIFRPSEEISEDFSVAFPVDI